MKKKFISLSITFCLAFLFSLSSAAIAPNDLTEKDANASTPVLLTCRYDSSGPKVKDYHFYRTRWVKQHNTGWWLTGIGSGILIVTGITAGNNLNMDFGGIDLFGSGTSNQPAPSKKNDTFFNIACITGLAMAATGIGLLISSDINKHKAKLKLSSQTLNPGIPGISTGRTNALALSMTIGK